MLLANYGSDSDSDSDSGPSVALPPPPPPKPAAAAAVKPKRKGPVKITIDMPKPSSAAAGSDEETEENGKSNGADVERPPAKRTKLAGAGSSSLLGMLPAPKRKLPQAKAASSGAAGLKVNRSMAAAPVARPAAPAPKVAPPTAGGDNDSDDDDAGPSLMMPASLARAAAKSKPKAEDAELDLFGLATARPSASTSNAATSATPHPPSISAAPAVADFVPPPPSASDEYPGYYQLPSGAWAAYDREYYASFFAQPADDGLAEAEVRKTARVGRDWRELDDGRADVLDVDVSSSVASAREAEARRALQVKPKMPGDEFVYEAKGQTKGLASERHQLTSLLSTAFNQREELEERIAQNKKNMRLATQKYGF